MGDIKCIQAIASERGRDGCTSPCMDTHESLTRIYCKLLHPIRQSGPFVNAGHMSGPLSNRPTKILFTNGPTIYRWPDIKQFSSILVWPNYRMMTTENDDNLRCLISATIVYICERTCNQRYSKRIMTAKRMKLRDLFDIGAVHPCHFTINLDTGRRTAPPSNLIVACWSAARL
jgi:hypothetical protein